MPDDDTNATFNSFDREPATNPTPRNNANPDRQEHADLQHRLEPDAADERMATTHATSNHTPQFQPQPVAPQPAPVTEPETLPQPGPGMLVLQWLVYALWGWTVFALSGLVILVVSQLLESDDGYGSYWYGGGIAYLLAAVIVLYVISLACDLFYARAERKHARSNGTNVIMIIHAVIFALFGIGALISSVFGGVRLMIGDFSDTTGAVAGIISGAVIFLLYGLTLLRTLRPRWIKGIAPVYWAIMTVVIIGFTIAGVVGPAAQSRLKAEDEVVASALPGVAESINEYANENGKLPASLDDMPITSNYAQQDDIRKLIDEDLVTYNPGEQIGTTTKTGSRGVQLFDGGTDVLQDMKTPVFHYELCVEFKTSSGYADDSYRSDYGDGDQQYDTTVSTYDHGKGKTCYDVQTDYIY